MIHYHLFYAIDRINYEYKAIDFIPTEEIEWYALNDPNQEFELFRRTGFKFCYYYYDADPLFGNMYGIPKNVNIEEFNLMHELKYL